MLRIVTALPDGLLCLFKLFQSRNRLRFRIDGVLGHKVNAVLVHFHPTSVASSDPDLVGYQLG